MLKILSFLLLVSLCLSEIKSESVEYKEIVNKIENLDILTILRAVKDDSTDECQNDIIGYLNATLHFKLWALQMFDASPKIPVGILGGNRKYLGHFDECLRVQHPAKQFIGQYCLLSFNINLGDFIDVKIPDVIEFGVCLPSTCTPLEIENAVNSAMKLLFDKHVTVTVEDENCRTSEPRKFRDEDWVAIGILIAFGVIALLSTIYDAYYTINKKSDKPHPLLTSFSLYSNGKNLFQVAQNTGQLTALNGIRVFSISWVVLLHSYLIVWSFGPVINFFDVGKFVKDPHKIVIVNATISVDTFFFLSGFLLCIVFFREMNKKGYYDVPLQYIHRYVRVTPSYAMTILIFSTIYTYMGDGPMWHSLNRNAIENCENSWWSGILYVQNFVDANSNCVTDHAWYLSTDMNFYWLSPLILYPIYFWPSFAFYFLGLVLVAAVCTNFTVAYVTGIGASLLTTLDERQQMAVDYTKFYMRGAPYITGIATALLICRIQSGEIKIKLNKVQVTIGWIVATGLCLASLYGLVPFTNFLVDKYSSLDAAFYLSLGRVAWSLGLAWIVFACLQGYGGPVNEFLSLGIFQPLAKLSYNVYLLHGIVELYRIGTLKTNINASDLETTYGFLGDLILSFLLAIPCTLLFEMPFGNIERYLTRKLRILPFPKRKKTA